MEDKVKGAWLVHHAQKIQATTNQDFDSIAFAGKCGTLLSAISASKQDQIPQRKLEALAKANHISPKTEMPSILTELERQKLILPGAGGYEILGLTGQSILEHTSTIFSESTHDPHEDAVIEASEIASESPLTERALSEYISDTFGLTSTNATSTLQLGQSIGFFDSENINNTDKLIFNGNLFRKEDAKKINAVLNSLKPAQSALVCELNERLQKSGCIPLDAANKMLGEELFKTLHSIGMFDVSVVGNEGGKNYFVTRPAAFSKFTNSIADDALDLAKALVASLTYGMTISSYYRGRITMISALMNKLIAGGTVGPATAIGNDYQALEYKGVVKVTPSARGMFTMTLLKPEIGRLALSVIQSGDIIAESIPNLPGAKVTEYINPEVSRTLVRKSADEGVKLGAKNLLNEIRTGGLTK
ncbi:hypothetical protein GTP23_08000 [Pseudoduganella sp. FT93W]|uniref:Uncharacterized protein n=1 Tax=Duganella fentianensis TaxID=2692177 RepID=A0A845HZV3_9BURK|nr:hypothetical protein [Duganella fentianensis]MYN45011.1 hypothetical protein [Duganella fentianensis]